MAFSFRAAWLLVLRETQTVVTGLTALAILRLRNAHSVYLAAGATVAAVVAKILKRFIRQPRPELSYKTSYGMPSTHSSSIAFFGVYLSLCIWNLRPHPRFLPHLLSRRGDSGDFSPAVRLFLTCTVAYLAFSVCWSRVKLTHHTAAQVVAGAAVGASIACLAFASWQAWLRPYARWSEETVERLLLDAWAAVVGRDARPVIDNVRGLHASWRQQVERVQRRREL